MYLYNPFDATLLVPFAARLEAAVRPDREILVAYVNPLHRQVFDRPDRYERARGTTDAWSCIACRSAQEKAA